ncbi:MAG: hypothetical protein GY835_23080, partial [bacterium]|nr:hypothetical protein [bacterium]
ENQTSAIDVQANDDSDSEGSGLTFSLTGSTDDALFNIDANTGVVTFLNAPDFEAPADNGGDNDYDIQVTVTDSGGLTAVQDIVISVNANADCNGNGVSDWDELTLGGLVGSYYPSTDFTGTPTVRIDGGIDFIWSSEPFPGFPADHFTVRWTGYVRSDSAGTYTFTTRTDDGVRLWVNGQLLINDWTSHAAVENTETIELAADTDVAIVMEYFENTVGAVAQLRWMPPGSSDAVIPATSLSPNLDADADGVLNDCDFCAGGNDKADLNGDKIVNLLDYHLLGADFGCTTNCTADITGDGKTDLLDVSAFCNAWLCGAGT